MSYFVISPKILECSAPAGGMVECAVTYDMEEYGIHRSLEQCQFSLALPASAHDAPCIQVKNAALSTPLYDAFWRGFYTYLINNLRLDVFSAPEAGGRARKFYLSDVHFEPTKTGSCSSSVKVVRH